MSMAALSYYTSALVRQWALTQGPCSFLLQGPPHPSAAVTGCRAPMDLPQLSNSSQEQNPHEPTMEVQKETRTVEPLAQINGCAEGWARDSTFLDCDCSKGDRAGSKARGTGLTCMHCL